MSDENKPIEFDKLNFHTAFHNRGKVVMSFDKPLPPVVFGEEPKYVAIRLDTPDIRGSLASSGLHAMANYPSQWTYLTVTEALAKLSAQPQDVAIGVGNAEELRHVSLPACQSCEEACAIARKMFEERIRPHLRAIEEVLK